MLILSCVQLFCSIVLHLHVYCSLKYFSSASPAASQVIPFCLFVPVGLLCFVCLWLFQLSPECHHSSCQSKLLCLCCGLLQKPAVPCRYVSYRAASVFCATHDMFCGQIRSVLSWAPVYFVLYFNEDITLAALEMTLSVLSSELTVYSVMLSKTQGCKTARRNVLCRSMHSPVCTWLQINAGCRAQRQGHESPFPPPLVSFPLLSRLVLAYQHSFPTKKLPCSFNMGS